MAKIGTKALLDKRHANPDEQFKVVTAPAPIRAMALQNLRRAILEMRFHAGQRLVERELCDLLGVSRTSVREALRQLETEGLVAVVPNRGPVVATVDPDEAAHIYEVREVLEALAARLFAVRASDAEVERLRALAKEIARAYDEDDPMPTLRAKSAFYSALFDGANNPVISDLLKGLHARITALRATAHPLVSRDRRQASMAELEAIVDAIANRQPDSAALACARHVRNAARAGAEALRELRTHRTGSDGAGS